MKEIKINPLLNSRDSENNYLLLFSEDGRFIGFIEEFCSDADVNLRYDSESYDSYDSIEELFRDYSGGTIKIISKQEMSTLIKNNLHG